MSDYPSDYPLVDSHGRKRTPFAVWCDGPWDMPGHGHGLVYLTKKEYKCQMDAPDSRWKCPLCRYEARWDDDNFEEMTE